MIEREPLDDDKTNKRINEGDEYDQRYRGRSVS
jgi:hypothetical protein